MTTKTYTFKFRDLLVLLFGLASHALTSLHRHLSLARLQLLLPLFVDESFTFLFLQRKGKHFYLLKRVYLGVGDQNNTLCGARVRCAWSAFKINVTRHFEFPNSAPSHPPSPPGIFVTVQDWEINVQFFKNKTTKHTDFATYWYFCTKLEWSYHSVWSSEWVLVHLRNSRN